MRSGCEFSFSTPASTASSTTSGATSGTASRAGKRRARSPVLGVMRNPEGEGSWIQVRFDDPGVCMKNPEVAGSSTQIGPGGGGGVFMINNEFFVAKAKAPSLQKEDKWPTICRRSNKEYPHSSEAFLYCLDG
jgi:hypothetical protein